MRLLTGLVAGFGAATMATAAAQADSLGAANPFSKYSDPQSVVAAVQTTFDAQPGQAVRLSVYDSKDAFLEVAAVKHQGALDDTGLALVRFYGLKPGEYAFTAYLDVNGDGKLNRGPLGAPKEPVAFSNGVVPKLRRPKFDETKVAVSPGSVVVITLED